MNHGPLVGIECKGCGAGNIFTLEVLTKSIESFPGKDEPEPEGSTWAYEVECGVCNHKAWVTLSKLEEMRTMITEHIAEHHAGVLQ